MAQKDHSYCRGWQMERKNENLQKSEFIIESSRGGRGGHLLLCRTRRQQRWWCKPSPSSPRSPARFWRCRFAEYGFANIAIMVEYGLIVSCLNVWSEINLLKSQCWEIDYNGDEKENLDKIFHALRTALKKRLLSNASFQCNSGKKSSYQILYWLTRIFCHFSFLISLDL